MICILLYFIDCILINILHTYTGAVNHDLPQTSSVNVPVGGTQDL